VERRADVGVFGGSGFYSFAAAPGVAGTVETVEVDTPFGAPAAPVTLAEVGGRRVAFLPRHGLHHEYPPHRVPAKANLWAFHALGVRQVIGPCAAGSLQPHLHPGEFVVLDQLIDRTHGRADTYYDRGNTHHVAFADPYCPEIGRLAVAAGRRLGITMHERGTVVVVQGPRFSTRAESRGYRALGADVVNMTQYPEAYLARELGMRYAGIALVTDYDTGVEDDPRVEPVTQAEVFAVFERNVEQVRALIAELVPALPADPEPFPDVPGPLDPYDR
jgi:5'-methylthioadenosine phosphorylase